MRLFFMYRILLLLVIPGLLLADTDKTEKNLVKLLNLIEKDPNNPHTMFYLGETSKKLGLINTSMKWLEKRVERGDLSEEVWRSYLTLGKCYEEKKELNRAEEAFTKAFQLNPKRAEALYELARFFRYKGQNEMATFYARQGKALPKPKTFTPLMSKEVYSYLLDEELSIASFYTPYKEEGYQALNRLLVNKEAPWYTKNQALNNAIFYSKQLKATLIPVDVQLPKITDTEYFNPMNPSIQKTENGYDVICRTVNYGQKNAKHFWSRDPNNKKIVTRNFLISMDKSFKRLSQEEILDKSNYPKFPWWYAEGKEDCRLFKFNGENWFTSSLVDANPNNTIQIGLGKIGEDASITQMTPLKGPDPKRCEKNWLPFVLNQQIHAIYSYDPLIVFKVDPITGTTKKVIETNSFLDTSRFRGSAGPVPFDDGYLVIVHEVAYTDRRYYLHRFIFLNKKFEITKASPLFYIKTIGIEYCAGMSLDHEGKHIAVTLGVEDKEAYIALVDVDEVKKSLTLTQ